LELTAVMTNRAGAVPRWVRIFSLLFAVANLVYGIAGYATSAILFPDLDGTGLGPTSPIVLHAVRELTARNLAIGVALLLVSLRGVPESIAIVMIIRALVELQTVILAVTGAGEVPVGVPGIVVPLVFFAFEVVVVRTMVGVIGKLERAG
jgi:hypothetical protein